MASDGAMIAPAAGFYEYFVCTQTTTGGNAGHRGLYVYQKTSGGTNQIDQVWSHNTYGYWSLISHRIIQMAQGDKVLWGYHNGYLAWNQSAVFFNCWGRRIK